MSLQVSARRRAEPATSTASLAGWARSAAASCSATGSTSESSSRSAAPSSASLSSAASTFSSAFGPRPLSVADPLLLGGRAQLLEARDAELVVERRAVFAPSPGTLVTSISEGGNFAFSFAAAGISPVSSSATIFSCERLADPGQLGRPAGARQLLDRDRALADHPRRLAVGEHAVADRAVELVQGRQLGSASAISAFRIGIGLHC